MTRLILWSAVLAAVVLLIAKSPNFMRMAGTMFGGPANMAWHVRDASVRGLDEHRALAADLFDGMLRQVPNSSSMPSNRYNPMPRVYDGGSGLLLQAVSLRNAGGAGSQGVVSFLYLYLPADPGDSVTKTEFWKGRSPDGIVLLMGYVDAQTGANTYGYPASGSIRVEREAPDRYRVSYAAITYKCASYVGGNGEPEGWLVDPDCPQNLFPRSIEYGPKPPNAG